MESALLRTELAFVVLALASAACTESIRVEVPTPVDYEAVDESYLWIAERGDEAVEVWAFQDAHSAVLPFETGDRITLLIYPGTRLEELGLQPGKIEPAADGEPGRGFSIPASIYEGEIDTGDTQLNPVDEAGDGVTAFRYSELAPKLCLEGGGCYSSSSIDLAGNPYCLRACEIVPSNPIAPAPLVVPDSPCETPWVRPAGTSTAICDRVPSDDCEGDLLPAGGCLRFDDSSETCPDSGDFHESPPPGALYVRPNAAPGGDGSTPGSAFATIDQALNALPAGPRTILLAAGAHAGPSAIDAGAGLVRIYGACPARTTVSGRTARNALFQIDAGSVEIKYLHADSDSDGFEVAAGAQLLIEDVDIDADQNGVVADGAVELRRSRIRDPGASGVVLSNSSSESVAYKVSSLIIRNPGADGMSLGGTPSGINMIDARLIGGPNSDRGFAAFGEQALTLTDVWFEDQRSGLVLQGGASAGTRRARFIDTSSTSVSVEAGANFMGVDGVFSGGSGRGIVSEGTVSFRQLAFVDSARQAMVFEGNAVAELSDVQLIRPQFNYAIAAGGSSRVTIEKMRVELPNQGGITARDTAEVTLRQVRIDQPERGLEEGQPPYLNCSGRKLTLERAALTNATGNGIEGSLGCELIGEDVLVSGSNGHGILLQQDANASFERLRVERSHETDFSMFDRSVVSMTDAGFGLAHRLETGETSLNWVLDGQRAKIQKFQLQAGKSSGVKIGRTIEVHLENGRISGKAIAVELEKAREMELKSILDEVLIEDGSIDLR